MGRPFGMWRHAPASLTRLLVGSFAAYCAGGSGAVFGQSPASPAGTRVDDPQLPVIIVTPEWRFVDLQQTPKTINHFSAAQLDAAGIDDTIDLQYAAPGFSFKTNSVLGQPYLRGVGSDFISAGAESSVATFADGVYLPRAFDSIVDLFDVTRVEILKGPQSVHLGRNVVGGAVSIHTREPGPQREGYLELQTGSYDQRRLRGAADLPSWDERFAVRIAASAGRRDGYTKNVLLGTRENGEDFQAWRAKLAFAPGERWSVLAATERHSEDSTRATGTKPTGVGVNGGVALGGYVPAEPRAIAENVAPYLAVEGVRHSARAAWTGPAFELVASAAYVSTDVALALDLDSTDAAFASNHPSATSRAFSQELRVSHAASAERAPEWTLGTYLSSEQANQTLDVRLPQAASRTVTDADVATRSYAVFGDVAYRFDDRWRGRLGLRYTHDARELDLVRTFQNPANSAPLTQALQDRWSAVTPEIGVEYAPTDDRLWYATAARGYKAGGFNTSTLQAPFAPELLEAYEGGVKTTLRSRSLRVNAALFYYDYEDLQLNTPPTNAPVGTFPRVVNAAEASIRGADVEVLYLSADGRWTLTLGAAVLDARFDEFVSIDPNNAAVNPDRSGNAMPQAPDLTANVSAERAWPTARGTLTATAALHHQSAVWFNIYEDPALRRHAIDIVDLSLAFEPSAGAWYALLTARNVTDELYAQTLLRNDPLGGVKVLWAPPRTVNLTVGWRW